MQNARVVQRARSLFKKSNKMTHQGDDAEARDMRMHSDRACKGSNDGSSRPEAVHGCADDSTGIASPLAAGIQTVNCRALPGDGIAEDPDGRAAPRLGAGEGGVVQEAALKPLIHDGQAVYEGLDNLLWKARSQVGGVGRFAAVAGGEPAMAGPAAEEVSHPLDGCRVRPAGQEIGQAFVTLLEMNAGQRVRAAGLGRVDGDNQPAVGVGNRCRLSLMPLVQK